MNTKSAVIISILVFVSLVSVVYAFVQQTAAKRAERDAVIQMERADKCEAVAQASLTRAQEHYEKALRLLKEAKAKRAADSLRKAGR